MTRAISDKFFKDLKVGILVSLTQRLKLDDTLLLALRGSYINVYYRGGVILKLAEAAVGYTASFDLQYIKDAEIEIKTPEVITITKPEHCQAWVAFLPLLKECMNSHMVRRRKSEREFQQLVAWENNRSGISGDTEYFITDIEYAATVDGVSMRADMLGVKWKARERAGLRGCVPVVIEMKYGIDAFKNPPNMEKNRKGSGIKDHFKDVCNFFGVSESGPNDAARERGYHFNEMIADQFQQLWNLDLINLNASGAFIEAKGRLPVAGKPEFVFLLANNNPRSKALSKALASIPEEKIEQAKAVFDLRFFAASFAGYGMHDACMLTWDQMLAELTDRKEAASVSN